MEISTKRSRYQRRINHEFILTSSDNNQLTSCSVDGIDESPTLAYNKRDFSSTLL